MIQCIQKNLDIIVDLFEGDKMKLFLTFLFIIMILVAILGFVVIYGGYLIYKSGEGFIFYLCFLGFMVLLGVVIAFSEDINIINGENY